MSESIERFREHSVYPNHPSGEGEYVRYSDHERIVKELKMRLAQAEQAFELETAVRLPEVGNLNVLQICS